MGLFGKIKNILFEDDDEVEEMPVYTKEEVEETSKKNDVTSKSEPIVDEPIKASSNSRFRNVKRDIDLNFDESDVLGEIPGARDVISNVNEEKPVEIRQVQEEKKSPFLSFDEDEFERLNSRINKNENRVKKEVKSVGVPVKTARKANNNFSATSTSKDTRIDNTDRYKINGGTLASGKKPFTPSPVISPVYGILDKNYTKEDIVDKQGGMKREKIVKPKVAKPEVQEEKKASENIFEVDIDTVRRKAYGGLEDLEKNLALDIPELKKDKEVVEVDEKVDIIDIPEADIEENINIDHEEIHEEPTIEDQLEDKFDVSQVTKEDLAEDNELDEVVEEVIEAKKEDSPKSKMLDELEKTSTLQILDDIEKELNSIKPISKDVDEDDEEENTKNYDNDDTLESDLFNLIDSMYEEGEEEEDD